MRRLSSQDELERLRNKARKRRNKQGTPPTVHYFHQVDDPYSHLAVQKLDQLSARYKLKFQPHLVSSPDASFQGDANHFAIWALRDAISVAPDYATQLLPTSTTPETTEVAWANHQLASQLDNSDFAQAAFEIGTQLWAGTAKPHTDLVPPPVVAEGDKLRRQLGHYQGAMFYFDGEWFWGIDRIRSLEQRLIDEGFDTAPGPVSVPEPTAENIAETKAAGSDASAVLLEYFPSLRSPYTAIGHTRVLEMVRETGVNLKVRPVMPMLMRGIPAPQPKQRYIITDAAREGREWGSPFGRIVDPFGEPVKRAFELFAGAQGLGRGMEFVTAYLRAAWFDGNDITRAAVLQQVVENTGLNFQQTLDQADELDWQAILQTNLDALIADHLWGVPSFKVSGGKLPGSYACWGQDRIWRVTSEIARRA